MFDKRMEDAGITPWCAGLNYGRSRVLRHPRHDSFEDAGIPHGQARRPFAFKYVCVGYAERKCSFYSKDADEGRGR